jgi:hypothetical protein
MMMRNKKETITVIFQEPKTLNPTDTSQDSAYTNKQALETIELINHKLYSIFTEMHKNNREVAQIEQEVEKLIQVQSTLRIKKSKVDAVLVNEKALDELLLKSIEDLQSKINESNTQIKIRDDRSKESFIRERDILIARQQEITSSATQRRKTNPELEPVTLINESNNLQSELSIIFENIDQLKNKIDPLKQKNISLHNQNQKLTKLKSRLSKEVKIFDKIWLYKIYFTDFFITGLRISIALSNSFSHNKMFSLAAEFVLNLFTTHKLYSNTNEQLSLYKEYSDEVLELNKPIFNKVKKLDYFNATLIKQVYITMPYVITYFTSQFQTSVFLTFAILDAASTTNFYEQVKSIGLNFYTTKNGHEINNTDQYIIRHDNSPLPIFSQRIKRQSTEFSFRKMILDQMENDTSIAKSELSCSL